VQNVIRGNLYRSRKALSVAGFLFMKYFNFTNVLLLLIFITLLGAWPFIGTLALIIIGVPIALWIIYILISSLVDVESWKETWLYIKPGLIATLIIMALLFTFLFIWENIDLIRNDQPNEFEPLTREQYQKAIKEGFSTEQVIEMEKIRKEEFMKKLRN